MTGVQTCALPISTTINLISDGTDATLIVGSKSNGVAAITVSDNSNIWNWVTNQALFYTENIEVSFPNVDTTNSKADRKSVV